MELSNPPRSNKFFFNQWHNCIRDFTHTRPLGVQSSKDWLVTKFCGFLTSEKYRILYWWNRHFLQLSFYDEAKVIESFWRDGFSLSTSAAFTQMFTVFFTLMFTYLWNYVFHFQWLDENQWLLPWRRCHITSWCGKSSRCPLEWSNWQPIWCFSSPCKYHQTGGCGESWRHFAFTEEIIW